MKETQIKKIVREGYGRIAKQGGSCRSAASTCCGDAGVPKNVSRMIGYTDEELKAVPDEANLGLGCGNPVAFASLKEGETVLDLGSGAGIDCFIAAGRVGKYGKVIGVDMTPEMIDRARANAGKSNFENVEFRLGEIENLPVGDNSADVVISNCVINLSSDKLRVFKEVRRALKPGGRIAISDIALKKRLPEKVQKSIEAYVGCIGGAMLVDDYRKLVEDAGLKDVKVTLKEFSSCTNDPIGRAIWDSLEQGESLEDYIVSLYVEGYK